MIIYLVTHTTSLKRYIELTSRSLDTRWNEHCYPSSSTGNRHLSRAIKKYGSSQFEKEILNEVSTKEEAKELERLWIIALRSYDPEYGYNLTYGGDGARHLSNESRLKMSASHRGKKPPQEVIAKRKLSLKKAWIKRKERGDLISLVQRCRENASKMKGKSYTEIYGAYRADKEAVKHSIGLVRSAKTKSQLPPVSRAEENFHGIYSKL